MSKIVTLKIRIIRLANLQQQKPCCNKLILLQDLDQSWISCQASILPSLSKTSQIIQKKVKRRNLIPQRTILSLKLRQTKIKYQTWTISIWLNLREDTQAQITLQITKQRATHYYMVQSRVNLTIIKKNRFRKTLQLKFKRKIQMSFHFSCTQNW